MRALFTVSLFLSSALLFLVEPMIAKMILPRFGGSPAVWNTAMLFFQIMLLLGYLYAHLSIKWLGPRRQAMAHGVLILLPLLVLPIALPAGWAVVGDANPAPLVLALLGITVGLPFFVLSAGAPVLQRWFASTDDKDAADPYFLYSASNLGSMIALLAYPLLMEPLLRLSDQSRAWSVGYYALVVLMLACAAVIIRRRAVEHVIEEGPAIPLPPEPEDAPAGARKGSPLYWVALAFVPSSLLLGVTTYLTTNIAPVPMLWVIPLALYLLSFILAFAKRPMANVPVLARVLPLVVTPLVLVMVLEASDPLAVLASMHLLAFFITALMCHGELARTRPGADRLTEFYLWISVGGVLGGVFNALVAPMVFKTLAEYPIALVMACALRPLAKPAKNPVLARRLDALYPVALGLVTVLGILWASLSGMADTHVRTGLTVGVPAILAFIAVDRPIRFALSLGAVLFVSNMMHVASGGKILLTDPSFFGVHRVVDTVEEPYGYRRLVHGTTLHGSQSLDPARQREPLTYYFPTGPMGQIFDAFHKEHKNPTCAFVGLGVGSLAAYGEPGEQIDFFEIDPVVKKISINPRYFTFISGSKANVRIIMGDARLMLARQPDQTYDLIVLDAFSSDAIPMHLLTLEATQMYLSKLSPHGIIVFHVSNRYLELWSMLGNIAAKLNLPCRYEDDSEVNAADTSRGKTPSHYVIMARNVSDFMSLAKDPQWTQVDPSPDAPTWTDDYSDILRVFKNTKRLYEP